MFNNLFKKEKTKGEIEDEISRAVNQIISDNPAGCRDFSELLLLDKSLTESPIMDAILALTFESSVIVAENTFFDNADIS